MKWTIGKKLISGFGVVLLIFAVSGFISIILIKNIKKSLDQIISVGTPSSAAAYEMEINMSELGFALLDYLHDSNPADLDRIKDAQGDFDKYFKQYQVIAKTEGWEKEAVNLNEVFLKYKKLSDKLVSNKDMQSEKIVALLEDYRKIDDLLDDKIQASIRRDDPQAYEKTQASMEMEINVNGLAKGLGNYLRTRQVKFEERIIKDEGDFKQALSDWEKLNLSAQERQWSKEILVLFEDTISTVREIIKLDKEIVSDHQEFIKLRVEMDVLMDDQIQTLTEENLITEETAARKIINTANTLILFLLLGGIIIGTIAATVITLGITRPLRLVVGRINEISESASDLTAQVPSSSKDEIGALASAFNKMLGGLKNMINKITGSAGSVSASSQQLSTAAQQTSASAQEVATTIQQLAKGAQQQAQGVEETTKVLEQLDVSITQGAKSAQEAAAASTQASESAQKGAKTVKTAVETMDKIENSTDVTSKAISKLGERSEQMAQIVNIITNVADQTNLLALNAAIEAARAGEAGKGFAVVADEVRKLAESSSKSAAEIGQLIKETISETETAVKNMEVSTKEVTTGKEMIAVAGTVLEEIIQSSEKVSSMLQDISASSQQMSLGAKQVVKSVEEVATIAEEASASTQQANASTQQMVSTMQQLTASSQGLSQMGVELRDLVGAFKTNGEIKKSRPAPFVPEPQPVKPITVRLDEAKKKMKIANQTEWPKAVGNGTRGGTKGKIKTEELRR